MMGYEENLIEGEVVNSAEPTKTPKLSQPKGNPKKDLMALLVGNGLSKEEVAGFVLETYGELDDIEKVKEIISPEKRNELIEKIKAFLNPKLPPKEEQHTQPDLFDGGPKEEDEEIPEIF